MMKGCRLPDPSIWPDSGALMPMAGHKGFGLAVLVDVLSAVLTGAQVSRDVLSWSQADPSQPTGHGHAFIAIHISSFMPITEFKKQMDDMIRNIRSAPRARNVERIIMPGELELERFVGSQKEGMTLPENVIESLNGLAADTGLDFNRYLTNPED
jgi:ureidoglycolate dehydrogenase (NAD+)